MAKAKKGNGGADRPKDPSKRLRKLIKGARVVMLTTLAGDGRLRCRPMMAGELNEGALWFLTRAPSAKTGDITDNQRVNLAYAAPKSGRYVSVSGVATIIRDAERVRELWEREHKAWFAGGKKDPELAVLRVQVENAEHWDKETGRMAPLSFEAPAKPPAPATKAPAPVSPGALG